MASNARSVSPFERFPVLKDQIEARQRWRFLDEHGAYFESDWKPKRWPASYRFLLVRRAVARQTKEALQLDLFEPRHIDHEYRVLVTNKRNSARRVLLFHYGRGAQEGIFAEAKQHAGLDLIPTRRLLGNQMVTLCAMMAHNLGREMQMRAQARSNYSRAKRPAAWTFQTLDTLRHRFIQRAGRLTRPKGELTLTPELQSESGKRSVAFPRNTEGCRLITPPPSNRFMQRLGSTVLAASARLARPASATGPAQFLCIPRHLLPRGRGPASEMIRRRALATALIDETATGRAADSSPHCGPRRRSRPWRRSRTPARRVPPGEGHAPHPPPLTPPAASDYTLFSSTARLCAAKKRFLTHLRSPPNPGEDDLSPSYAK